MRSALPRYSAAGASDQGSVRSNNEDRVYCDEGRGVFLVVDGMGGHQAGEHAADLALQRIRARLERPTDSVEQRIREAITLANNAIYSAAEEQPEWKGMACVLTVAVIENGQVTVGHVGDSRLYRVKREAIQKLTHDHSPVGEREDGGELTELAAMQHPRRNEVYRDVGSTEHTPDDPEFIEILEFPFEDDSALLLCTDGLSDAITSEQMAAIIQQNLGDRTATVRRLIEAAARVGRDNISAVWVEGPEFAASFNRGTRAGKNRLNQAVEDAQPSSDPHAGGRWYSSGLACLLYGIVLGIGFVFCIDAFGFDPWELHRAQTLTVIAPQSISDSLQKARPGDTIRVAPGTYPESIVLSEGVTLVAEPTGQATIAGTVTAKGLRSGRLEGFQIRGSEFGVQLNDSNVVLARNDIEGSLKAGIECNGSSRGAIVACTIRSNQGPGILVNDSAAPAIENNLIVQNGTATDSLRPGLSVHSSSMPAVLANVFSGNGAEAIWMPTADESIVEGNAFSLGGSTDARPKIRIVPLQDGRP